MKRAVFVCSVLLAVLLLAVPVFASVGDDDGGFNLIDFLLNGLKGLFVPSDSFLAEWQNDLSERFDAKFGGIKSALGYLSGRFESLREYRDLGGLFDLVFPRGSFLYGIRVNLLDPARDVLSWIRFCMTGVVVIASALACYHKVNRMLGK